MVHPVQSVIESLYAAGRCPRIHVNALADGVVCPDFIREQWGERLIIDLDPSYPLDLTFQEKHLEADLSFGGYVSRCIFPYDVIYVVADRSTGRGIVLDQNMPESVRSGRYVPPGAAKSAPKKPPLRTVDGATAGDGTDPRTPQPAEGAADAGAQNAPAPAGGASRSKQDDAGPEARTKDEDAKKRRAAFRVIDGGS